MKSLEVNMIPIYTNNQEKWHTIRFIMLGGENTREQKLKQRGKWKQENLCLDENDPDF